MEYQIEAKPIGVFSSTLEFRWFCRLRQFTKDVRYVGNVDRWRDFVVNGCNVEIKPSSGCDELGLCSEVWRRVPVECNSLHLLLGDPVCFSIYKISRDGSGFQVFEKKGSGLHGLS
jgi:hypothetical protein